LPVLPEESSGDIEIGGGAIELDIGSLGDEFFPLFGGGVFGHLVILLGRGFSIVGWIGDLGVEGGYGRECNSYIYSIPDASRSNRRDPGTIWLSSFIKNSSAKTYINS